VQPDKKRRVDGVKASSLARGEIVDGILDQLGVTMAFSKSHFLQVKVGATNVGETRSAICQKSLPVGLLSFQSVHFFDMATGVAP
jgi:hypothetical protein